MISNLHIETAWQAGKTILKNCFYTPPFKVLDITEDKREAILHIMLMNASPGVLDGDAYHLQLKVAADTSMQLHTQSYQRLFCMEKCASQSVEVNLEQRSSLYYVPHPTVPHAGSNFSSKTKIHLAQHSTLIWGDVLTCGRKERGEQFIFSKYHSSTEIFLNTQLVVKENLFLQPQLFNTTALGQFEGYTHQASLLYLNEDASIKDLDDHFQEMLSLQNDICFGITALPVNGFIVRLLGYKGEQLYGLLKKLANELVLTTTKQKSSIKQESYAD